MSFRKVLQIGTVAMVFSIGIGCNSADDKPPPRAETTPGTPKLEKKMPGAGGAAPGGAKPGAPGPGSQ